MTVTTRPRNKEAHPGLVDAGAQSNQHAPRSEVKSKNPDDAEKIIALETRLLTEKEERMASAREPPGPSVTLKQQAHTRLSTVTASRPISLAMSRQLAMSTYNDYYGCCTRVIMILAGDDANDAASDTNDKRGPHTGGTHDKSPISAREPPTNQPHNKPSTAGRPISLATSKKVAMSTYIMILLLHWSNNRSSRRFS